MNQINGLGLAQRKVKIFSHNQIHIESAQSPLGAVQRPACIDAHSELTKQSRHTMRTLLHQFTHALTIYNCLLLIQLTDSGCDIFYRYRHHLCPRYSVWIQTLGSF